jgi:tetratricopeptide (TPR) repeat protein
MDKDKAIKEIKQLKELFDNGILTQEEYDKKSSDLKKIILDSQDKKNELSISDKEYWEQKVKEKSNTEKEIIPAKKEESELNEKVEVQEKVDLKDTSNNSSKDSNENDTLKTSGGFRKWLNKKETPLNNFLYISLGFIVIPTNFFVFETFQNYILGLANGSSTYGDYPFDSNYVYLFIWLVIGTPFILFLSYLISLIKSLKVKTNKVFFLFTLFFILMFLRSFQTTIYPALNLEQNNVSEAQTNISEAWQKEAKKKEESGDFLGALNDYNNAIQSNPFSDNLYQRRAWVKSLLNDYDGGIEDINKAIEINPNHYYHYLIKATLSGSLKSGTPSVSVSCRGEEYCYDCILVFKGYDLAKNHNVSNKTIKNIKEKFSGCWVF